MSRRREPHAWPEGHLRCAAPELLRQLGRLADALGVELLPKTRKSRASGSPGGARQEGGAALAGRVART